MPDASVHAVVTDPPYGLEFMGKEWDSFKPGGKRPGFGNPDGSKFRQNIGTPSWGATGNPTCHNCGGDKYRNGPRKCRCDAPNFGNHMADQMRAFQAWCEQWAAECIRVLKPGGHMLAFGGTRTYHRLVCAIEDTGFEVRDSIHWIYGSGFPKSLDVSKAIDKAAGATREVIGASPFAARKPNGTWTGEVYGNEPSRRTGPVVTAPATDDDRRWQGWGTAIKPSHEPIVVARKPLAGTFAKNVLTHGTGALNIDGSRIDTGRWPSNIVLTHPAACNNGPCASECPVAEMDVQGNGASRFFPVFRYQAKANRRERPSVNGVAHPTVKPLALMRWLVRLVTPPGGVVLDMFAGSGTTGEAAALEGVRCVLIERDPAYLPLIMSRLATPPAA